MAKPIYGLIGRVNIPDKPIVEEGRFECRLNIHREDDDAAIAEAKKIFGEKFSRLENGQSIMGYVYKDGTAIHTFPEVKKE